MLFLAPATVAGLSIQWGNNLLPMVVIWMFGSVILRWSAGCTSRSPTSRRSSFFAVLRALITGHPLLSEVAPITGPMYQLFIFFMITDPKTTVGPKWAQSLVAFLVAVVEAVFRLMQFVYAPFYALFLVGPIAQPDRNRAHRQVARAREGSPRSRPAAGHRERIWRWLPRIFPWFASIRFWLRST